MVVRWRQLSEPNDQVRTDSSKRLSLLAYPWACLEAARLDLLTKSRLRLTTP